MKSTKHPINRHQNYHAHIYFDQDTTEQARTLCADISPLFELRVGRFHEKPVGPHPMWSCQITFSSNDFDTFIPWLDENRSGLSILIHGVTGDDIKDHTDYAYWLGKSVELNLKIFGVE